MFVKSNISTNWRWYILFWKTLRDIVYTILFYAYFAYPTNINTGLDTHEKSYDNMLTNLR